MFKTIHECRLDLVAHSVSSSKYFACMNVLDGGVDDDSYDPDLDFMPCSAARVSFGNEDKTGEDMEKDKKLMAYLAKHQHMTPFEHQSATFLVEVPLFIRSQIHRHRTFAYNEISRRYTDENLEFWIPDKWRKQSASNRQASDGTFDPDSTVPDSDKITYGALVEFHKGKCRLALDDYNYLVSCGVAREQARADLPQSLLTKFYMTGNLRNWVHFLKLRLDEHSQYEVRVVAERIEEKLGELWPNAVAALMDN